MKKKFLLILLIALLGFFCYCEDTLKTEEHEPIITAFDTEEMANRHLSDFNLIRERGRFYTGKEYVFQRESDSMNVFITVGFHPSAQDAENVAIAYLNGIAMVMMEGPIPGESIGDKLWWWAPNSDPNNVIDIVFIRNNALFIMSCSDSYDELPALAKAIDDDIINGELYITIEDSLLLPIINSISCGKNTIQEGESTKITVHAIDPKGELLEYQSQPGLIKNTNDPENVFTLIASLDYVSEPFFSTHTFKFVVINESNVVSKTAEIDISIIP